MEPSREKRLPRNLREDDCPKEVADVCLMPETPKWPLDPFTPPPLLQNTGPASSSKADVSAALALGSITWVAPLAWLEKTLIDSPVLEALRQSLPVPALKKDKGTSVTLVSMMSAATWMSPPSVPEARPNAEDKDSVLHQELDKDDSAMPVFAATWMSPLTLTEAVASTTPKGLTSFLEQEWAMDNSTTPVSVASAAGWMSPPSILETGPNASPKDLTSVLERATDNRTTPVSVASAAGWMSPSSLLETRADASPEEKASVLQQELCKDNSVTPVSVASAAAWMSPMSILETGPNASPEIKASVLQQEWDKGSKTTPVSVVSEVTRMSPLNSLESGPNASLEGKASFLPQGRDMDKSTTPVSMAPAAIWTSSPDIQETGPNASLEDKASALRQDQGNHNTSAPVSMACAATWMSPLNLLETGVNTSLEERASTKDSTAETDSLLWHCSRDQLSGLSRAELEGRLESTLIIMEALCLQIRACQELQRPPAHLGPADQRDVATQTILSEAKEEMQLHRDLCMELQKRYQSLQKTRQSQQVLVQMLATAIDEMKVWSSDSVLRQEMAEASFQRLHEDRRSLNQQQKQVGDLISRCLGRWCQKEEAMKKALKAKEAADRVLELFRSHAGDRIRQLERGFRAQQRLHGLLEEASELQADLSVGYGKHLEQESCLATALQSNWAQMSRDYEAWRNMTGRFRATMRRMQEEVGAARRQFTQHSEVCQKLEECTLELVLALGRVNELLTAKTHLQTELEDTQEKVTVAERKQEQLREEKEILSQQLLEKQGVIQKLEVEAKRLSQEKARVEQERDSVQRDAREVSDCREFIEQENQIARRQLTETEEELKASLSTLRERSAQLEDLKDTHEKLQQEQEAVGKELAGSKAEIQSTRASMAAFSKSLLEVEEAQTQFLEIAGFLRAALRGEVVDMAPRSRACTPGRYTPHRGLGASFVDSVLQAAAEKDVETPGIWSDTTAFTKAAPVALPTPAELEARLAACAQDLQEAAEQLRLLTSRHQRAAQEEGQGLRAENAQFRGQLESLEKQLEAETDSRDASIAKLSKTLHTQRQTEKELQEVLWDQDRRLQLLTDQSGEVMRLQEEVAQLQLALQKSETTTSALWEQLRGQNPSGADSVQEKIWLRQEVGKLRQLLLQKDDENIGLVTRNQSQVRYLEEQVFHAQQGLRRLRKTEVEIKEALSSLPADVASLVPVRSLLNLLA
ncbi:sperm-associated antigen 5 [Rhineura floridana]|uniref:sperm-associated antigen 5 n=1 Tax=Rhineura floridana TaxID=261503 RepID=UPI002AC8238B|nr:sperm-associated antigen 5 [Rhineura floridana]